MRHAPESTRATAGRSILSVLSLALLLVATGNAHGAGRHDVIGTTFEFIPRDITIAPGDTVQWIWDFGTHTVTEGEDCTLDNPLFNALLDGTHPTFRYVFDSPGIVHYFCLPHCVIRDMQGTVTVTSGTEGRVYEADADGAQTVPPVESPATAKLRAYLSSGEDRLHVQVAVQGLVNTMIGCHLHTGPPGSNGPMLVNLGIFEDSLAVDVPVPPTLLAPLREGNVYLAIHTEPYPAGEIRGQLGAVAARTFQAVLDPSQVTDPVDSDGIGFAQVYTWPDSSRLHVELEVSGLTSNVIGSHIHEGLPGENGPIRFDLGAFEGRIVRDFGTTPAEVATLLAGGYYLDVETENFVSGEIRGQIVEQTVSAVPGTGDGDPPPDGAPNPLALAVRPTVTSGAVELGFELAEEGAVSIEAYSATGRRLGATQLRGHSGANRIDLDLETAFGVTFPRGRLFLLVRAGDREGTTQVTVWK